MGYNPSYWFLGPPCSSQNDPAQVLAFGGLPLNETTWDDMNRGF